MKISNFQIIAEGPPSKIWATVDVTQGFWFLRTKRRTVHSDCGYSWFFTDTGEYVLGFQIQQLYRALKARESMPPAQGGNS